MLFEIWVMISTRLAERFIFTRSIMTLLNDAFNVDLVNIIVDLFIF